MSCADQEAVRPTRASPEVLDASQLFRHPTAPHLAACHRAVGWLSPSGLTPKRATTFDIPRRRVKAGITALAQIIDAQKGYRRAPCLPAHGVERQLTAIVRQHDRGSGLPTTECPFSLSFQETAHSTSRARDRRSSGP